MPGCEEYSDRPLTFNAVCRKYTRKEREPMSTKPSYTQSIASWRFNVSKRGDARARWTRSLAPI